MQRHSVPARPYWQAKLERLGFDYHSIDGDYWQETACYRFSAAHIDLLEDSTNTLHELCLEAVDFIIRHDRFAQLGIDALSAQLIEESWRRGDASLYGRFDLVYHPLYTPTPKLLEYNADTPTSLFEASVVQWYWLQDNFPNNDQFNSIHERLITQWRLIAERLAATSTLTFATITDSIEDVVTCRYLQDTAIQAGLETQLMDLRALGWLDSSEQSGQFVDLDDAPVQALFKLYPWEWLLEEPFAAHLSSSKTTWLEPIWKLLLSNKGLLPILWELNPNHPNLLPSYFAAERERLSTHHLPNGIIQKPLFSREGANISALAADFTPTGLATPGEYGDPATAQMIYQAMSPLPKFISAQKKPVYPVIGSWVIGNVAAGIGIREDDSLITKDSSHFVPHYFIP
ncbi:glutathionylspermidine synthase family protein [Psychrobacter pygoscelis]|uniref:glutathionylspermidine synthase family protein n=1 Tax=Psychrobacter pygoscelis TaxID=2488563 RepID=UPI00103A2669|nr:glutathionylspermidine synthase family protein [Psychrobacter pygoscelis]